MQSSICEIISGKAGRIYVLILSQILKYTDAHSLIDAFYSQYKNEYPNNPSINGKIFEWLVCETLKKENIVPFYYQVEFELIPDTCFDIVLYQKKCPVVLSVKTSLRERYKQADLEAFALRQVYRNSKSFLITLSEEWKSVQEKIDRVNLFALNQCLKADTLQYSEWLKSLKNQIFYPAKKVNPISKGVMIS